MRKNAQWSSENSMSLFSLFKGAVVIFSGNIKTCKVEKLKDDLFEATVCLIHHMNRHVPRKECFL